MPNPPKKARPLTPSEIAANKAARRQTRKIAKKLRLTNANLHSKQSVSTQQEFAKIWPFVVVLPDKMGQLNRYEIRQWFKEQNMRVYDPVLDNKDRAQVVWNKTWTKLYFANQKDSTLFSLFWL